MRALEKPKPITTKFDRTFALENPRPRDQSKIDHNLQWYAKHSSPDRKGGVKHREAEKIRYRNIHKHLVTGVLSEDAEKEVTDNIMFASPLHTKEPKQRGGISKKIALSHKFQGAVKTLKEYDTDDRWGSGLNANTLMTEYRRKVLFHALLDSGDVDESREHAQEKVRRFITVNFPHELTEEDKLDEARERPEKSTPSSSRSKSSTKRGTVHETNFSPKYEDYDVMANRWRYLRPQLNSLMARNDLIPQTTSRKTQTLTGHTVTGIVQDIVRFEGQMDSRRRRQQLSHQGSSSTLR